ncbi:hypothetical protein Ddye_021222 [Dipteronia dyeriana]|uniref:Uncharacterized protein n=1 Tax=Dipteronia dyeriana TaxID=168575 RepID=A0AAD9U1D2_9ROSI|nr:hypothetical protein Ddye_021222 [Dipteronia dyeriana]
MSIRTWIWGPIDRWFSFVAWYASKGRSGSVRSGDSEERLDSSVSCTMKVAFQNTTPVIASDTKFTKLSDGSIQTTYEPIVATTSEAPASTPSAPLVFQVLMVCPVISEEEIPIHSFETDGSPIYTDKILKSEGLLLVEPKKILPSPLHPIPCFMAFSYDKDFPSLEPSSNSERNLFSRPFIQTTEISDGSLKQSSQAEQVLNWYSHNARVHNRVLHSIDQKIDQVTHHVS